MAQIIKHIHYVNEGFSQNKPHHEFPDLQSAINEIGADEKILIQVSSDLQNVPELIFTNPRTDITIDGLEHFEITFQNRICRITDDHNLKFTNLAMLHGDDIVMSGNDTNLILNDIDDMNANITLDSGSRNILRIDGINFYDINTAVLDIDNRETIININNSYMKGGIHNPAILYHTLNNHMTIKNSTLIHGDDTGIPIQVDGAYVPELRLYGCSGATKLTDGNVTNWIIDNLSISNEYIGV